MRTGFAHLPLHGGKDGFPYPVDRRTYENTIAVFRKALERGKIDRGEKMQALKRLARVEMAAEHASNPESVR